MLHGFANVRWALVAGVASLYAAGASPAFAVSAPALQSVGMGASAASDVVRVHSRNTRHAHRRRHHIVEAPFTRVETSRHRYHRNRRAVVDAPFAHVMTDRHGRHVIAPFVDLWVPR